MNPKKIARKVLPKKGARLAEEVYRRGRVYGLQAVHRFPARGMRVIGVTGTDGKTTTSNFINEMLKSVGYKTAMYTTAVIEINGEKQPNLTHRTVPLTAELVSFFKRVKAANVDFVVMEVTSMALHQHKMNGIPIEVGVMTNLTQEHLDYHKTMENYAAAKALLFNKYTHPKYAVLNHDDEWYEYFKSQAVGQVISYGQNKDSFVQITGVKLSNRGGDFTLKIGDESAKSHIQLIGEFNVYNASAAAGVGAALGLSVKQIAKGIGELQSVPGRMESLETGKKFQVIIDYAVTPEALQNVLTSVKKATTGKVAIVFGATGDRDKTKREPMGEVAGKLADRIFLTDDETYTEDPASIRASVMQGINKVKAERKTTELDDREEAIKQAIAEAKAGDIIVISGMGHQKDRNMGGKLVAWSDAEIAQKYL